MVNIDGLVTETVNEDTRNIDEQDALGIVTMINREDKKVAEAIEAELPQIAKAVGLRPEDCVIGIAASGRTPYTVSALEYGKRVGAQTVSITCNSASGPWSLGGRG